MAVGIRPDGTWGLLQDGGIQTPVSGAPATPIQGLGTLDAIGTGADVLSGVAGLASAYTGYKGLGLAEDQVAFEKALANANFANQAKLVNTSIQNAGDVGLALASQAMTPEQRAARQTQLDASKVQSTIQG